MVSNLYSLKGSKSLYIGNLFILTKSDIFLSVAVFDIYSTIILCNLKYSQYILLFIAKKSRFISSYSISINLL